MTTDLRSRLHPQIENIKNCAKVVKKAIALAKATSDQKEQEHQEHERKLASKHRKQFSIFASRAQKEHESDREWQMQKDQELLSKFHGFFCRSHIDEDRGEENETPRLFINVPVPNEFPSDSQKAAC